ncbi:hypothetical protein DL93DRAFT_2077004 [Clavulina sp. PMI_390]|nr:hypothetical protein DL93DRAFT_2077004 [Clavulina sp. PMI_390]
MSEVVDVDGSTGVLAAYCFMTGFVDAVSFTACFIWCAFQTGNTIQLSLALARLFSGEGQTSTFLMPDRQALASLSSFLGGSFFGRLGDRYNPKTRGWLSFATLMQAGLTMAAALCAWKAHQSGFTSSRADPSWTDAYGFLALAFASASMGLQAQVGTRMGSQFATTVVLTSVWVALVSDPVLFRAPTKIYPQRDYRMLAIASVFLGGFVGRALTGSIGPAATLGIGAGIRLFIAPAWFLVQKAKKKV